MAISVQSFIDDFKQLFCCPYWKKIQELDGSLMSMQVPTKEQVQALTEDLQSRSKIPGIW